MEGAWVPEFLPGVGLSGTAEGQHVNSHCQLLRLGGCPRTLIITPVWKRGLQQLAMQR